MDELISRQDAIDAIRQYSHFDDFDTSVIDEEIAIIAIKDLPSVQPKERCIANITINEEELDRIVKEQVEEIKELLPRNGKWLRSGSDIFPYECDQCGDTNERSTPWCPNCGCRMEEGDAE